MAIKDQLIGCTFNRLLVIEQVPCPEKNKWKDSYWKCLCSCGNPIPVIVSGHNLKGNSVMSCRCLNKEKLKEYREEQLKLKEDLTGRVFSQLTVLERYASNIWKCICDCEGHGIIYACEWDLRNGKTKSCGCFRRHRLAYGENSFNRLYDTYKRRSKNKEIEFEFSKEDFKEITQKNCYYCNCEPSQIATPTISKNFGTYVYNGIDRLDNSKGYTLENSVPCCGFCNVAKNNYTEEEFLSKIKNIYENRFHNKTSIL